MHSMHRLSPLLYEKWADCLRVQRREENVQDFAELQPRRARAGSERNISQPHTNLASDVGELVKNVLSSIWGAKFFSCWDIVVFH